MFHVKHEGWELLERACDTQLDSTARNRFEEYGRLLIETAIPKGMVGQADAKDLVRRHFADGLRAIPLLEGASDLADAGSGAGVPGIPIAITLPDLPVTVLEQRRQRVAFLELVVEHLDLPHVRVVQTKVPRTDPRFDVVTARALGDASTSWRLTEPLLTDSGRLFYWAGSSWDERADRPQHVRLTTVTTSALAEAGPLVIMARQ